MARSLRLREDLIPTVKSSLLRNGFPSQKILAEDLGISQSTVSNFLNGKPVDYANFLEICRILAQEWRNIADFADNHALDVISDRKVSVLISDRSSHPTLAYHLQQEICNAVHEVTILNANSFPLSSLQMCDYLLLLLSPNAAVSEMILEEVLLVKETQKSHQQKPTVLPICINLPWKNGLSFDLVEMLAGCQPWQWRSTEDTNAIASELCNIFQQNRTSFSANHQLAINWENITISAFTSPTLLQPLPVAAPELPEGQVELASYFYIDRPPIESRCYEAIDQPGALIRIKAPRQMGKTSLMARILHHAEQQNSTTLALTFQLANKRVFTNSDTFLQWFCASVAQELGILEQLTKCWELAEIIGSNQCCKAFFEQYVLPEIPNYLTLGLDEVDRVFESPEIADDFFGLLRALHEEAKRRDIWKKFRLIVVHSTEVYIPLDINKSPFNVGLPIELPEFNSQQLQELAIKHGLDWHQEQIEKLMDLVGGHPYLVRLAMYHIARQDVTLEQVLAEGATAAGIYSDHLRRHLWNLEKYPELLTAMKEVVSSEGGVRLRSEQAFKLNSMGLVKLDGNNCTAKCNLYAQYFL
ncbi:AAA-like domain-containing protein [Aerosakkonemataceae cyanobacterium BLCC-F154]|uniref:AAA-like domain-containing protein n=1 Tax=Floridaenema fluviatile BLCC-F154 TaxID=3153640 RepID=A0ABV4YH11_9CYAN